MENLKSVLSSKSTSTINNSKVDIDVDKMVGMLREKLKDPYLGKAFVKKALKTLPPHELFSIAEFALREGNHPGKVFVSVCNKEMK